MSERTRKTWFLSIEESAEEGYRLPGKRELPLAAALHQVEVLLSLALRLASAHASIAF